MKKLLSLATVTLVAVGLTACQPGYNTPGATAVGAAAGGLVGGQIFGGAAGIVGGALLGGVIGNQIGQEMDRRDRAYMESAIINGPVHQPVTWVNERRHKTYTVTPMKAYQREGNMCREYRTVVDMDGQKRTAYGTACRMPDGKWQVMNG